MPPETGWRAVLDAGFVGMTHAYDRGVLEPAAPAVHAGRLLRDTAGGTVYLFHTTPKGFFPQEDIGQLSVSTEARQDISFDAMVALQNQVEQASEPRPMCRRRLDRRRWRRIQQPQYRSALRRAEAAIRAAGDAGAAAHLPPRPVHFPASTS